MRFSVTSLFSERHFLLKMRWSVIISLGRAILVFEYFLFLVFLTLYQTFAASVFRMIGSGQLVQQSVSISLLLWYCSISFIWTYLPIPVQFTLVWVAHYLPFHFFSEIYQPLASTERKETLLVDNLSPQSHKWNFFSPLLVCCWPPRCQSSLL